MKGKVKRRVIAWVLSFALVMGTVLGAGTFYEGSCGRCGSFVYH